MLIVLLIVFTVECYEQPTVSYEDTQLARCLNVTENLIKTPIWRGVLIRISVTFDVTYQL